eukprot:jgi/Botrbrau1/18905/Bobra.177_2s0062.1
MNMLRSQLIALMTDDGNVNDDGSSHEIAGHCYRNTALHHNLVEVKDEPLSCSPR